MRDTSLTSDDLAIMNAKENLASIDRRPGYAQAMASSPLTSSPAMVRGGLVVGAIFGLLIVPVVLYVDTTWLRVVVIVAFALVALFALLAALGSTEKLSTKERWPAAVIAKLGDAEDAHKVTLLVASGEQHTVTTDAPTFALLRPGDVGIAEISGSAPDHALAGFHRL
jgi:hypothetical protein